MRKQSVLSRPITLDAVIEPSLICGDGLQSVRLIHSGGELMAWSWNRIEPTNTASVLTATVHVNPFGQPLGLTSIIERIQWRPGMPVTGLIPGAADADGLADRLRTLIREMRHPGLQQLLQDVFVLRQMFYDYWKATVPIDGEGYLLAERSIRNAELVQCSIGLSSFQRSLGVAFALLRDAGRAWPTGRWLDGSHSLHLLGQIQGAISHLARQYPEDADVLVELLQHEHRLSLSSLALSILEHVDCLSGTQNAEADGSRSATRFPPVPANLISMGDFLRRREARVPS